RAGRENTVGLGADEVVTADTAVDGEPAQKFWIRTMVNDERRHRAVETNTDPMTTRKTQDGWKERFMLSLGATQLIVARSAAAGRLEAQELDRSQLAPAGVR